MADDEFSFDDDAKGADTELSLDDFFEPAGGAAAEAKAEPKGPSIDDFFSPAEDEPASNLPIEKSKAEKSKPAKAKAEPPPLTKIDEIGADEVDDVGGGPPPVPPDGPGDEDGAPKPGLLSGKLIFIVIGVLVFAVVSAGGYLGYSLLFDKEPEVVINTPAKPPVKPTPPVKPDKPAPDATKPAPDAAKPAPDKPPVIEIIEDTPPVKPDKPVKPDQPAPAKPVVEIIEDTPPVKPAKPAKPVLPAVTGSGGPFTVQVGSYLMEASKRDPETKLTGLGYSDFHYVPESRRIKIYNVYVGRSMSREDAQQAKAKLENMGYYPELVDDGAGYKVLVYSYGSSAVAKSTQQKVARAGLKPVEVKAESKQATLDQLRVGRYATRAEAEKARQQLSRSGFKGAEIVME